MELRAVLDVYLADQRSAWEMQADGNYLQRGAHASDGGEGSHALLIARAERRLKESLKQKKKKSKIKQ